jgi:hypothetical protein
MNIHANGAHKNNNNNNSTTILTRATQNNTKDGHSKQMVAQVIMSEDLKQIFFWVDYKI